MAAGETFKFIAKATATTTTTSISFSSIPTTYDHLVLYIAARSDRGSSYYDIRGTFNNDTGNNYTQQINGSESQTSPNAARINSVAYLRFGPVPADHSTASVFSNNRIIIGNYKNTSTYKPITVDGAAENMSSANVSNQFLLVDGIWQSTSAISSIQIFMPADNFVSGTTAYLYGLANA